jgi:hypothetical protein
MSATFSNNNNPSAKATFAGYNQPLNGGEYVRNKKIQTSFCNPNICNSNKPVGSQSNYLFIKYSNLLTFNAERTYDNTDIYSGLFTAIDLSGVPVIKNNITPPFVSPTPISDTVIPYKEYYIDPSGILFGNTPCGYYNYENFIVSSNNVTN